MNIHLGAVPSWLSVYQVWCSECSLCLVPSLMVFFWEPIERLATPLFSHDALHGFVIFYIFIVFLYTGGYFVVG